MMIIKERERERACAQRREKGGWGLGIDERAFIKRHCVRLFAFKRQL